MNEPQAVSNLTGTSDLAKYTPESCELPKSGSSTAAATSNKYPGKKLYKVRPPLELTDVTISKIDEEFVWFQRYDKVQAQEEFDQMVQDTLSSETIEKIPRSDQKLYTLCLAPYGKFR